MQTKTKIASGSSLSGVVDLRDTVLKAVQFPSSWTAADISVQASADGITFGEVFLDTGNGTGAALALDAAASQVTVINANVFIGDCYVKLRSGPSGAPVNQAGDREITLITALI